MREEERRGEERGGEGEEGLCRGTPSTWTSVENVQKTIVVCWLPGDGRSWLNMFACSLLRLGNGSNVNTAEAVMMHPG